MPKTESARKTLQALNPDVAVDEHRTRLTRDNALELFSKYDVIVDGSDNFGTRYLVNDACVLLGKPNEDAGVVRSEEHTSELQSLAYIVCRLLLEKKKDLSTN